MAISFTSTNTVLLALKADGKNVYEAFGYSGILGVDWKGTLRSTSYKVDIGFEAQGLDMKHFPSKLSEAESLPRIKADNQYSGRNFQVKKFINGAAA